MAASELPSGFPGDPIDRVIAATSLVVGIPLVTKDQGILAPPRIQTIW